MKNFYQFKITFYFKFAINQNKSINQKSKISNSMNFHFHQHMFAKTIRIIFNKWFKISIILSYKTAIFFSRIYFKEIERVIIQIARDFWSFFFFIFFFEFRSIFQILITIVAFATIFSNSIIVYVDIYEQFIFVKRFVVIRKILRNTIAISTRMLDHMTKKWVLFFYFFYCIINNFFDKWIVDFSTRENNFNKTQRKRCDFFRSITFVTNNFHIKLKSKYLD